MEKDGYTGITTRKLPMQFLRISFIKNTFVLNLYVKQGWSPAQFKLRPKSLAN